LKTYPRFLSDNFDLFTSTPQNEDRHKDAVANLAHVSISVGFNPEKLSKATFSVAAIEWQITDANSKVVADIHRVYSHCPLRVERGLIRITKCWRNLQTRFFSITSYDNLPIS